MFVVRATFEYGTDDENDDWCYTIDWDNKDHVRRFASDADTAIRNGASVTTESEPHMLATFPTKYPLNRIPDRFYSRLSDCAVNSNYRHWKSNTL